MNASTKLATAVLLASIGTAALTAQVSSTGRPSPIRLGQPDPAQVASSADPSIAQLKAEVAGLKNEIGELRKALTSQDNARKSLAMQHFKIAGVVNTLNNDFYSHQHHQNWLSVANTSDGSGTVKMSVSTMTVSPPISTCVSKAPPPGKPASALRWDDRYNCTPPQ